MATVAAVARDRTCEVLFARVSSLRPHHHELLDDYERLRQERIRHQADVDRFTAAAVLLRAAVALRSEVRPAEVEVSRTCERCGEPHGVPRLPRMRLAASISHSGDHVAVALCASGPVGVDIEADHALDWRPLVPTVCSAGEESHILSAKDFLTYWTRKEALLKAVGCGLRIPMIQVVVTPPASEPAVITYCGRSPPGCQMRDVAPGERYAGSVAVLTEAAVRFVVSDGDRLLASI